MCCIDYLKNHNGFLNCLIYLGIVYKEQKKVVILLVLLKIEGSKGSKNPNYLNIFKKLL